MMKHVFITVLIPLTTLAMHHTHYMVKTTDGSLRLTHEQLQRLPTLATCASDSRSHSLTLPVGSTAAVRYLISATPLQTRTESIITFPGVISYQTLGQPLPQDPQLLASIFQTADFLAIPDPIIQHIKEALAQRYREGAITNQHLKTVLPFALHRDLIKEIMLDESYNVFARTQQIPLLNELTPELAELPVESFNNLAAHYRQRFPGKRLYQAIELLCLDGKIVALHEPTHLNDASFFQRGLSLLAPATIDYASTTLLMAMKLARRVNRPGVISYCTPYESTPIDPLLQHLTNDELLKLHSLVRDLTIYALGRPCCHELEERILDDRLSYTEFRRHIWQRMAYYYHSLRPTVINKLKAAEAHINPQNQ